MSKTILVISASLRTGSNSDALADAFVRGAKDAGCRVQKISLRGQDIRFCKGCLACQQTRRCVIRDGMDDILPLMQSADAVAFATPVYFYGMCGQMKTLLDRTNPLFPAAPRFRDVYLLAAAADGDEQAMEGSICGLQGWIDCFEQCRFAGSVFAGGVTAPGEVQGHPALQRAYELGRNA